MARARTKETNSPDTGSEPPDYVAIAERYARDAVADRRGKWTCKWTRLCAQRHLNDLKRAKSGRWEYYFDPWHAEDVCGFIEKLPHVEGEWDTKTITLAPPQVFWLCCIFGWRRKSDRRRRFTRVYLEMARKNAKSTLAAAVSLYCLTCEGEVGPQIIIGATTGEQARKIFRPAQEMVKKTPDLREAFQVAAMSRSIPCYSNGGFIQPINAKSESQDGWNPHVGLLDELHAHKTRGLYDVIRSGMGGRKNPLLWVITTAGYNVLGVCYEQRTFLTKVLQGVVEADHVWGIIYTIDEEERDADGRVTKKGDDVFDESCWPKANPMLGVSVDLKEMQGYAIEARNSPESYGEFVTKRLNVWTRAKKGHVNITIWLQKTRGPVDLDALVKVPCWGGLDLASVSDMNAFRLVWKVGDRVITWGRRYLPEDVIAPRTSQGNVPYQVWKRAGLLVPTPGNVTDYDFIERDIMWALDTFNVQAIGFDPWNSTDLVNRLLNKGAPMVLFRQGTPTFNAPMKELDRLYLSGHLDTDGDPILDWCASNVVSRKDVNENIAPDKKHSSEKIDDYVALVMAIGMSMTEEKSVYEERGIVVL